LVTFFGFIARRFLRLVLRFFALLMVRLFLDFLAVRFFAAFFAVFFFAGGFVAAGGGVGGDIMGEGLNSPGMVPVGSLGLIPNMPTIGLVPSILDILASESSSRRQQHRATSQELPTENIYVAGQTRIHHEPLMRIARIHCDAANR
jgi:hypothetical protein